MALAYHDLLSLSKIVRRVPVQDEFTQGLNGHYIFREDLRRIKHIETKGQRIALLDNLHAKLPLRKVAVFDSVPQIFSVVVRVATRENLRFFPEQASAALQRLEMELDELAVAVVGDHAEGVDTEAVGMSVRSRDAPARHGPKEGVQRAGLLAEKVPGCVVSGRRLRHFVVWFRLHGVDKVREADGVLNEEDGDVVSNDI